MDPEKFDKVVLDLLYDELDELTRASALRHVEQSSSARTLYSNLRATREVGSLPLIEPPDDLEERILNAERTARAERPLKQRLGSVVSVLAGYAMRPQLAMAALFLFMIGASLLFLRAKPGDHDAVQVTERGVPELEREGVALVPVPEGPTPAQAAQSHGVLRSWAEDEEASKAPPSRPPADERLALREKSRKAKAEPPEPRVARRSAESAGAGLPSKSRNDLDDVEGESPASPFDNAMDAFQAGRFTEAREQFDEITRSKGPRAPEAALYAARAALAASGCAVAVFRFEQVAERYPSTPSASQALWKAAQCHQQLGQMDRARVALRTLAKDPANGERARAALGTLEATPSADGVAAAAPAEAKASRKARPAAKPAAPPAATKSEP